MSYDFDPTVVTNVPKNASDFKRVFDPEGVQEFLMFDIVDSQERSLFEFNLANKEYDKLNVAVPVESRADRVNRLAAFYAENAAAEISPFEDAEEINEI